MGKVPIPILILALIDIIVSDHTTQHPFLLFTVVIRLLHTAGIVRVASNAKAFLCFCWEMWYTRCRPHVPRFLWGKKKIVTANIF